MPLVKNIYKVVPKKVFVRIEKRKNQIRTSVGGWNFSVLQICFV